MKKARIGFPVYDAFLNISKLNTMGLIKEPKNVDFTVKSKPWTSEELKDFRKLMAELKAKNGGKSLAKNKTKSGKKKNAIA